MPACPARFIFTSLPTIPIWSMTRPIDSAPAAMRRLVDIEANTYPQTAQLAFNGITDVYTFRYDGFAGGDFIKLQLNGNPAPARGASFGGFLFDLTFEPNLTLPHPGDYNGDNHVDAADYVVWRKTLGSIGFFLPADGHPDNEINSLDFDVWRAHFGETAGGGAGYTRASSRPPCPRAEASCC